LALSSPDTGTKNYPITETRLFITVKIHLRTPSDFNIIGEVNSN